MALVVKNSRFQLFLSLLEGTQSLKILMIAKCRSLIDDRLSVRWTLSLKDCERWFILSSVYLIVSSELEYLSDLLHCKPSLGFFPVFSYSRSLFISERTAHLNEYLCDVTVV